MKDKYVLRDNQHGFAKGKLCLTSVLTFPVEKTGSVGKGRAVDKTYFMSQTASLPALSPTSEWHKRMGNGGYSQTITVCLCHFFLLHIYLLLLAIHRPKMEQVFGLV